MDTTRRCARPPLFLRPQFEAWFHGAPVAPQRTPLEAAIEAYANGADVDRQAPKTERESGIPESGLRRPCVTPLWHPGARAAIAAVGS